VGGTSVLSGYHQNGLAFTLPMKYTWHMCFQQPSNVVEMGESWGILGLEYLVFSRFSGFP